MPDSELGWPPFKLYTDHGSDMVVPVDFVDFVPLLRTGEGRFKLSMLPMTTPTSGLMLPPFGLKTVQGPVDAHMVVFSEEGFMVEKGFKRLESFLTEVDDGVSLGDSQKSGAEVGREVRWLDGKCFAMMGPVVNYRNSALAFIDKSPQENSRTGLN